MARAARRPPTVQELDERLTRLEQESGQNVATRDLVLDMKAELLRAIQDTKANLLQSITEAQSSNDVMFKVLLRQREDDRVLADQRQAALVAMLEKIVVRPQEN